MNYLEISGAARN